MPNMDQSLGIMDSTPSDSPESIVKTNDITDANPDTKKKLWDDFRSRIAICKGYRKKLIANWTVNIDYRRGKPFASQTDEDRIAVNLDWSMEKTKHAALFSQVPQVHVDHFPQSINQGPGIYGFEQKLNDIINAAGIETAIDECLPDVINAAGIGAVICSHESIMEQKSIPSSDLSTYPPEQIQQILTSKTLPDGTPLQMQTVPSMTDHRYLIQRVSPADLLWPISFTGADFDNAPWIGRSGRVTWAQAVQLFNLTEQDRQYTLAEERTTLDRLTHDLDKDKTTTDELVGFDEIFYKEFQFDENAKSYSTIHHLVFIPGKDQPVIDEPWKGQQIDPQSGTVLGSLRFPIRVLTLTYITDETIPPSDSAISRPQVNEINKSRTQMIQQRERSLPIRWFDVNGIDATIQQSLMRGTWQGMIPVQGSGQNRIGEVARATMPQENFTFDSIAKNDLSEILGIGPNQNGSFAGGRQSASEANIVQSDFTTRIGRERARIAKFFCSIAEVIGGFITLYEDPQSFGQGFDKTINKTLSYSILADSTVLVDSNQRLKRLMDFINFTAKSGWVDIGPVLKEIATLSGLDPSVVIKPPQPKPPAEPNVSLRLTGVEDMLNPMTLAILMKSGQAPTPELVEQAKKLIQLAVVPPLPPAPPQGGAPGQPPPPPGPGGPPSGPVPPQQIVPPSPPPPTVGMAHPNWNLIPKIDKRESEQ